jgi:DNA repair exonuclease SbcCD ATPase subunit
MGFGGNLINFFVVLIPPVAIWLLFRKKKKVILSQSAETDIQKAHRNQDLKDWKTHYNETFTKFVFPALILSSLLTVGGSIMDTKSDKIVELHKNVQDLKENHGTRIKTIEEFLFPPTGPTSPTIFKRLDALEENRKEIEGLLLRVTDPNPELRRKVEELETQITLLRQELKELKQKISPKQSQKLVSGSM